MVPNQQRYTLGRELGGGGMSTVYLVQHAELQKPFAMKVLRAEHRNEPSILERFRREARVIAERRHPHLVRIHDVGDDPALGPYLVMDYLPGETLEHIVDTGGPLPLQRALDLLLPVMHAVFVLHLNGVIHRDLKPANVMVIHDDAGIEQAILVDLGIAKVSSLLQITFDITGSLPYMPSEQFLDSAAVDARADGYALAVTLYELLTGRLPYQNDNILVLQRLVGAGGAPSPAAYGIKLPADLEAALMRQMSPDRDARFPDLAAFARTLLPYASPAVRLTWEPRFAALSETTINESGPTVPSTAVFDEDAPTQAWSQENSATTRRATTQHHDLSQAHPRASVLPANGVLWAVIAASSILLAVAGFFLLRGP